MTTTNILAFVAAVSLMGSPALAQTTTDQETNGHHYQGGPKTEVPHHMGKKDTVGETKSPSGGHHYSGGPKTEVPHHMGEKN
jgi:hypothetical protein